MPLEMFSFKHSVSSIIESASLVIDLVELKLN